MEDIAREAAAGTTYTAYYGVINGVRDTIPTSFSAESRKKHKASCFKRESVSHTTHFGVPASHQVLLHPQTRHKQTDFSGYRYYDVCNGCGNRVLANSFEGLL